VNLSERGTLARSTDDMQVTPTVPGLREVINATVAMPANFEVMQDR
jgi:hypothetical protein